MNRRWCLLVTAGVALLAAVCWLGDSVVFLSESANVGKSLRGWTTNTAYAAPPSPGSVIRLAPPKYHGLDDDAPGLIASDQKAPAAKGAEVRPVAGVEPRASRPSSLDGFESTLPDDEPEELVAGRPLPPRRSQPDNSPFVSRQKRPEESSQPREADSRSSRSARAMSSRRAPSAVAPTPDYPADNPESRSTLRDATNELSEEPSAPSNEFAPRELPTLESADMSATPEETIADPSQISEEPSFERAQTIDPIPQKSGESSPFDRNTAAPSAESERSVMLRWQTPTEIQVDTESECQLLVENTTESKLVNVKVEAQLPAGLRLVRAEPTAAEQNGKLSWDCATLESHEQRQIHLWVVPTGEGEVEPTATVTFSHATAARLNVIHPQLQIQADGPGSTLAGQPASIRVQVSNPGTGKARNVVVELRLDPRLKHQGGNELRYALGTLASGESREVQVALNPTEAAVYEVQASATAEPGLSNETRCELEVIKPTLQVVVEGPRLRYVDRQATYSIKVHNPGPAPADNVQVFDDVPSGFRFVDASSGGTFDAEARQVAWFVGRLEPNQTTEVNVQLVATEPGEQRISAEVKADAGVSETAEAVTRVEGVASVALDVVDADDPIEVAGETTYEIRLTNRGSQPAHGVQAAAKLPAELQAVEATGPTDGKIQGHQVVFEPLVSLAPGQTQVYKVRVLCKREGQVTFRAYFRDADHPNAVAEEELTRVYQD